MAILARADRPCPKEGCDQTAWEAFQVRIDRSRLSGSRGEIRPQRILGTGVTMFRGKQRLLRIRRLELPLPPPETGDPPGAETIAGVAAIAAARRPTTRSGFSGRTSFGKW